MSQDADQAKVPEGKAPEAGTRTHLEDAVRIAIPLGVALLVVILVALGLEGDVRSRFIRNNPVAVGWAFVLVLAGVSLPVFARALSRPTRRRGAGRWVGPAGTALGAALVLAGAIVIAVAGASNVALREQPDISVSVTVPTAESTLVDVTVTASAASLASRDRLLLRIATVGDDADPWLDRICRQPGRPGEELSRVPPAQMQELAGRQQDPAQTPLWHEAGPLTDGDVETTYRLQVDRSAYRYVCVYAGLTTRGEDSSARYSVAVADLSYAPVGTPATASTPAVASTPAATPGS